MDLTFRELHMPKPIFVENLSKENLKELTYLVNISNKGLDKRAKIILLSNQGYTISEISKNIGVHYQNVRKWVYRFSENGVKGLYHGNKGRRNKLKYGKEIKKRIAEIARLKPSSVDLPFVRWTLEKLKEYLVNKKIVEPNIAIETIRNILMINEIDWRKKGEEYGNLSTNGIIIRFDNKGKITDWKVKRLQIRRLEDCREEITLIEQEITIKKPTTLFASYDPIRNKLVVRLYNKDID